MTSFNNSIQDIVPSTPDIDIEMSSNKPTIKSSFLPLIDNQTNPLNEISMQSNESKPQPMTTDNQINPLNEISMQSNESNESKPQPMATDNPVSIAESIAGSDVQSHHSVARTEPGAGILPLEMRYDDYYVEEYDPQNTKTFKEDDIERIGAVQYSPQFVGPLFLAVGKGKMIWLHRDYVPDLLIVKFFEHEHTECYIRSNHVRTDKPILIVFMKPRIFGQHHLTLLQVDALKKYIRNKQMNE